MKIEYDSYETLWVVRDNDDEVLTMCTTKEFAIDWCKAEIESFLKQYG